MGLRGIGGAERETERMEEKEREGWEESERETQAAIDKV